VHGSVWFPFITLSVGHGARPLLTLYGFNSLGGTKLLEEGVLLRYSTHASRSTLVFLSIIPRGLSSFLLFCLRYKGLVLFSYTVHTRPCPAILDFGCFGYQVTIRLLSR
jgi:hypothetical protein